MRPRRDQGPPHVHFHPQHATQNNHASGHGVVNAHQGSGPMNIVQNFLSPTRRGYGGWLLLILVVVDVIYFFYGMLSYSGDPDNSADMWRAWIFLFLVVWTLRTVRRLLKRKF
jgi:hypothetical protein